MLILLGAVAATFVIFFLLNVWSWKHKTMESLAYATLCALFLGSFVGGTGWAIAREANLEEVPIRFSIYEGPSGRYVDNGTSGEYNSQITIYYWKDGDVLRKSWKSAGSVGIQTAEGDYGYARMTCPSVATLPNWLKMPWEKADDYVADPNCAEEFINLYIPEGEN